MKVQDNQQWVEAQFGQCDLGDVRRNRRLKTVASHMLASPELTLPQQNVQWSDLKAAYRLFDNDHVTFDAVADEHWQQTRKTKPGRYLFISDTTDVNFTSHRATTGLGQLGNGVGRGMQLHNCLVYSCNDELPVGIAGALVHYRIKVPKKETRTQRLSRIRESQLWGNLVTKIGSPPEGSQWIHVFDRGGDNFEAMCQIRLTNCDWIIRAAKLHRNVITKSGDKMPLKDALKGSRRLSSYTLDIPSRRGVKARTAELTVSTVKVTFPMPRHRSQWVKECGIKELPMNVVIVEELTPPKGVKPIRWILLTSLTVEKFDDAWQIIEDYENRWLIEEYHKCLKTGCRMEGHALRSAERIEPLIGVISVIGARLIQMKMIGRSQKEARAVTHVPSKWLHCLKLARPKLKLTGMTVYEFFRELAKLGGFLARTGDGEPGWQTVWRGYKKLHSLLDGMQLVGAI